MMMTGIGRVGNDPVVRYTSDNKAVLDISLAFACGKKDATGSRPTQWVTASLWGDRATRIAPHVTKGKLLFVALSEVHVETFAMRDGAGMGASLKARVADIELIPSRPPEAENSPAVGQTPAQNKGGFGDLADDIPF